MELLEAIRSRRSVRIFEDRKVDRTLLEELISLASYAPSASNKQLWHFIIVDNTDVKKDLVNKGCSKVFLRVPVIMFVTYSKKEETDRRDNVQSASAAIQNFLLAAHEKSIGTCWFNDYGPDKVVESLLNIPKDYRIVSAILIGYPKEVPRCPVHKKDIYSYNKFVKLNSIPDSCDVRDWTVDQLREHQSLIIRGKSPLEYFYKPQQEKEYRSILNKIPKLSGKVLAVLPLIGQEYIELIKQNKIEELLAYDLSEEVLYFLKSAILNLFPKFNIECTTNLQKECNFALCLKAIERHPSPNNLISEIRKSLKINGTLYLSFTNKQSTYYLWQKYLEYRGGPYGPLVMPKTLYNLREVKRMLKGFEIKRITGINLFPKSPFEGFCTITPLKQFCNTIFIEAIRIE